MHIHQSTLLFAVSRCLRSPPSAANTSPFATGLDIGLHTTQVQKHAIVPLLFAAAPLPFWEFLSTNVTQTYSMYLDNLTFSYPFILLHINWYDTRYGISIRHVWTVIVPNIYSVYLMSKVLFSITNLFCLLLLFVFLRHHKNLTSYSWRHTHISFSFPI